MFTVADLMTVNPYTLSETHTLFDAQALMNREEIRHIPILNTSGQLCGVVSQRDILAAQHSQLEGPCSDPQTLYNTPLRSVMSEHYMTVTPHASLKQAALYMQRHKIGCLPVVKGTSVVGIITDSDFVTIAINLLELQEESEPLGAEEDTLSEESRY
uniref:CBS domain-containing protein n=1 Tax=Thaumasiovibrio occultus TaxID=1891184 RepID=UPI000B35BF76|nr:CBS domain-containing protein [Thaumasiovibrio occultus]